MHLISEALRNEQRREKKGKEGKERKGGKKRRKIGREKREEKEKDIFSNPESESIGLALAEVD